MLKRSDRTTRQIIFTSENIKVPAGVQSGDTIDPGVIILRLELTLSYQ